MFPLPKKNLFGCLSVALAGLVNTDPLLSGSDGLEHFEKKIRPLLMDHCLACHGPAQQDGGLRLDSKTGWVTGGDAGPAIIPGKAKDSPLIRALRFQDKFQGHPEHGLSEDRIIDLEYWIQAGAPDPRSGATHRETLPNYERAKDFWSFQPIIKPEVPQVKDGKWAYGAIDQFVRAAQEAKGLTPVADANKNRLVRRAHFALIGLPPTPEQIDDFVNDPHPGAYERLVDELLNSLHYGERWGRHWLDVARFAESSGGGRTLLLKDAWRYRDYVIEAFNADMPYDQMVCEQIAGDLLPYDSAAQRGRQLTATAFLALGPTNYELQDKQLLRYDVIDEQIDTLGKAFLGMTLGCARCHDHKFDPVPTTDYYAMAGIFKSTRTLFSYNANVARWVDTPLPLEGAEAEEMAKVEAMEAALKPRLKQKKAELSLLTQKDINPPPPGKPSSISKFPGILVDERAAEPKGQWKFSQYSQNYLNDGYYHDGNEHKGEKTLTFKTTLPLTGRYEVRLAYAEAKNRSTKTPVTIGHLNGETTVIVNQQKAPALDGRFHSLGTLKFARKGENFVRISTGNTDGHVVADAVQWLLVEDDNAASSPERETFLVALKEEIKGLEEELKPLTIKLDSRPLAMTVKEDPEPSDSAVRIRGMESRKGEIVPRGFLRIATLRDPPNIPEDESGRRQLAEWMVSPDNPLTARVMANRIWSWLFGTGIVRSVDNLGTTGELPSHPELLDYLAVRLREHNWSIKAMVKEIMLSRTWQLSSEVDPKAEKLDPDNRLLTCYPLRRLDAEQLRDAILAVNGELDLTLYGPNIEGAGAINAESTGAQQIEYNYIFKDKRRSVYTPAFRVKRHELFEVFDFGNVNFTMGQRNVSTVALQALYMLNNPFVLEQSKHAAGRLLKEVRHPDKRVDAAFRRTLGRLPSEKERSLVTGFFQDGQLGDAVDEWALLFQSLFGSIEFRYLN